LNIKVNDIQNEHLIDVFLGTSNDKIQHEACLWEHKTLENAFRVARNVEVKIMGIRRSTTHNYKDGNFGATFFLCNIFDHIEISYQNLGYIKMSLS